MIKLIISDKTDILIVDVFKKVKEEAVKYFSRVSWRLRQSRSTRYYVWQNSAWSLWCCHKQQQFVSVYLVHLVNVEKANRIEQDLAASGWRPPDRVNLLRP